MKFLLPSFLFAAALILAACDTNDPNTPPSTPRVIRGTDSAHVDERVEVLVVAEDPERKPITYEVDWGDGRPVQEYPDVESGLWFTIVHHYFASGTFVMRCRAVDADGRISGWSDPFAITVEGNAVVGKGDWWMFMRDPQHSGHSLFAGPSTARLHWRFDTRSPIRSGASFDAFGTLHIGADDFHLRAIYPDGEVKWIYDAGFAWMRNVPALHSDGSLFFGSSSSNIYRIGREGVKIWNTSVNASVLRSNAVLDEDGNVFIGSTDFTVYSLRSDGSVRWRLLTNGPVEGSPALSLDGATLYIGSGDQIVYAVDTDNGKAVWTFPTAAPISGSPAVGSNGNIYIGNEAGFLFALRPDGNVEWSLDLHSPIYTTPAVTREGYIHVMTAEGKLHWVDIAGNLLRSVAVAPVGGESSPVVDVYGRVYIGTPDGRMTAISPGGSVLWQYDTKGAVHSTAAIGADGELVFGCDDGSIYVIRDP